MKDKKYTKEDKRYMESMWIDFGVILVFAIPCCSNIPGLENYGIITGIIPIVLFFGVIFLIRKHVRAHNLILLCFPGFTIFKYNRHE
jgi:hypothetical protein